MIPYLVDTNHVSAMLKNHPAMVAKVAQTAGKASLGISMPSIAELWYMTFYSVKIQTNMAALEEVLKDLRRWEFDEAAAVEFGRIKAELRKIGRPIPDFDIQIAATARLNDLTVLTADTHFSNVANLKIENWLL